MKKLSKVISIILAATFMVSGCHKEKEEELVSEKSYQYENGVNYEEALDEDYDVDEMNEAYINYCFNLANLCVSDDTNTLISPASVMLALNMAAAGANNNTLDQMTSVFAPDIDVTNDQMQAYASDYQNRLTGNEDFSLHVANSLWGKSSVLRSVINNSFLDFMEEAYDAEVNMADFSQETINEMNDWVNENTDGMIPYIINELNPDAVMVIINAIAFEASWAQAYEDYQVSDNVFHSVNGDQTVTFLNEEIGNFYETSMATGFRKYYEGYDYYFLAILPNEDVDANTFLSDFSGEDYLEFINSNTYYDSVITRMPEFTYDYDITLNEPLMELGMADAFNPVTADFSNIAQLPDSNLVISRVLHKTHIELDRNGTRAAAATAVLMDEACCIEESEPKIIELNRPFVYAIVEKDTNIPLFIGTVNEI